MTNGYLINNKQIIALAKWFLANPLLPKRPVSYGTLSKDSIARAKKAIRDATENPDLKAFKADTLNNIFGDNSYADGFKLGMFYNFDGNQNSYADAPLSVNDYISYLKKQQIVGWGYVSSYAKTANAKVDRSAQLIDEKITAVAKNSKSRIQYHKFVDNNYNQDDVIREYLRGKDWSATNEYLAENDLHDLALYHDRIVFKEFNTPKSQWKPLKFSADTGKRNTLYKIAVLAYMKWSLPYANLKVFNHKNCIKSDVNLKRLSNQSNYVQIHDKNFKVSSTDNNISDESELADYRRFVEPELIK